MDACGPRTSVTTIKVKLKGYLWWINISCYIRLGLATELGFYFEDSSLRILKLYCSLITSNVSQVEFCLIFLPLIKFQMAVSVGITHYSLLLIAIMRARYYIRPIQIAQ